MIDAIQNQGYDPHKVALLITQTGGGCRASNYIHMLRKALDKAGLSFVPVLSLSFGLEKNPGFHWSIGLIRRLIYGMMYGDLIMNVANQVLDRFDQGDGMTRKKMREILDEICADFKTIPVAGEPKIRVGVVGEIYIKFSALGNNQLEEFLLEEGAEPVVPGLTDFLIFKIYNRVSDVEMFGGSRAKQALCKFFMGYVEKCQLDMIEALTKAGFRAPGTFAQLHELIHGYLNDGCKMGEGWLLTAEMLELIHSGTPNIVCAHRGQGHDPGAQGRLSRLQYCGCGLRPRCHQDQPGKPHQTHAGQRQAGRRPGGGSHPAGGGSLLIGDNKPLFDSAPAGPTLGLCRGAAS